MHTLDIRPQKAHLAAIRVPVPREHVNGPDIRFPPSRRGSAVPTGCLQVQIPEARAASSLPRLCGARSATARAGKTIYDDVF